MWPNVYIKLSILAFYNNETCSIAYFWTIRFKIWPSLKKALKKVDKYFLIFPKVATFRHVWSHWVADTPPHKPTSPYCKIVWRQIFDSDNFHHPNPPKAPPLSFRPFWLVFSWDPPHVFCSFLLVFCVTPPQVFCSFGFSTGCLRGVYLTKFWRKNSLKTILICY